MLLAGALSGMPCPPIVLNSLATLPAGGFDLVGHKLTELHQMHLVRHELSEEVDHRGDRLGEVAVLHAGGTPQRDGSRHVVALGGSARPHLPSGMKKRSRKSNERFP